MSGEVHGMAIDRIAAITALLAETGAAHGQYEETVLHGVYHKEWAVWYAAYAVDHGMGELLGHPVTADALAAFLAGTNVDFEQIEPKPAEPWAAYTAGRIAAEL
jgi:hypothetical protein